MKRSSEAGPRCPQCGALAAIVAPGLAKCHAEVPQLGGFGRYCGREFPFIIETRTFYIVDEEWQVQTQPLPGGGSVA